MSEMPSTIIDVLSCNDKSRWEFITSIEIIKPKHYYLNGKCVYCEVEALKEREKFLNEDLQTVIKQREKYIKLHYEAEEREAKLKAKLEKAIMQRNEWRHRYASATKSNTYSELIKQNEEIGGVGE